MNYHDNQQDDLMLESFKDNKGNNNRLNDSRAEKGQSTGKDGGAVRSILRSHDPAMESFDPNDDLEDLINGKRNIQQDQHGVNAKAKAGAKVNTLGNEQEVNASVEANANVSNQLHSNQDALRKQQTSAKINKQASNQLQRLEDMEERDDLDDLEDEIGDLSLEEIKSLDKESWGAEDKSPNEGFAFGNLANIPDDQPLELLRRGTTQIFALDADNELSYSKMQALVNSQHPRVELDGKNGKTFKQMPLFKTRIGWHCCCRPCRRSDINKYGEGTSYYFKTLKFLNILFLIATIVNVPLFVMYSVGGGTNNQTGLKYYLSGLSLAYMGTNYFGCNFDQVTLPKENEINIYFSCEQGFLCDLKSFGLDNSQANKTNETSSSCNQDGFIYYDQNCNMTSFNESTFNYLTDTYDTQCKDKQSCNFTVSLAKLPAACRNYTGSKLFFSQAQCAVTGINLSSSSYLDKGQIALIIAIFDVFFAIILGVALLILKCLQDLEHLEIKGITLDAAKFTIQLQGLPAHKNIYYLKAEIWKWAVGQLKRIKDEEDEEDSLNHKQIQDGETKKVGSRKNVSPKSNQVANRNSQPHQNEENQHPNKTIQDDEEIEDQSNLINSQKGAAQSPLTFQKQLRDNKINQNYENNQNSKDKQGIDSDEEDERKKEAKKNKIVDITLGLSDYQNVIHLCFINMFYKQLRLCYLRLEKIMANASLPNPQMRGPYAPGLANLNGPFMSPVGALKGPDGVKISSQNIPNLEGLQEPNAPNLKGMPNVQKPEGIALGEIAAPSVGNLEGPSGPNLQAGVPQLQSLDPSLLKMKAKIEQEIEAIKIKLQKRLDMYDLWVSQNVQVGICAFIQFRSMLDMIRFLTGFELSFFENCCFRCAKRKPHIQARMLQGKWPASLKAPDPANILWVNLGYSKCSTFFRRLFIAIISIILMAGSFIAIIYAKDFEKQVQLRYNMNTDCGYETYTQSQVIYQEQQAQLQVATSFNYLHCYCLQQYKLVSTEVVDIKFSDGNYYCKDWAYDYAISNMFVYVIAFIIVACNIIVKFILRYITFFEKPKTVGMRSFSIMIKIFCIQFVNTVMILILVNWRITRKYEAVVEGYTYQVPKPIFGDNFVIFSGRYTDFTPEFFKTVGTTLLLTMIINIVSPNFFNFSFYLMKKMRQCCDRGCSLDKRRTKLLIQEDYEALYTGPELLFEGRYATLLTTFFACLFLSFGMPLFYVVGFLSFFFTFWVDKYLFLRHYRLPPLGDRNLATWSRLLMCVAVMFHLIIAFMMISNNALFGTYCGSLDFSSFKETLTTTLQAIPFIYIIFDPKRFDYGHSILLFVVMFVAVAVVVLVIVLGSIILSLYLDCKASLKRCRKYCRPGGCCACCGKMSSCCKARCCANGCGGCFKKIFAVCFACLCCKRCKASCKTNCAGCFNPRGCMRCSCLLAPCWRKLFSCCFKGKVDIMDGMRVLIDYQPIISLDFYKEISLYELRLLYLRTNYELKRLTAALGGDRLAFTGPKGSLAVELDAQHPLAFIELKDFYLERKVAIEFEIRARLIDLQAKAKIPGNLSLETETGLLKGLDAAIQLKGSLIHLKRLSGLFSYDIKFSPEYMHCIKMKEKLPELRKILAQGKEQKEHQDNRN